MAQEMRWWVTTEEDEYGYTFAETKPQIFTWVWAFISPDGFKRPVKKWVRITDVANYN